VAQPVSEEAISLAVKSSDAMEALDVLKVEFQLEIIADGIKVSLHQEKFGAMAVIGEGMQGMQGITARVASALCRAKVNIVAYAQSANEKDISIIVREVELKVAAIAVHHEFFGDETIAVFIIGLGSVGVEFARKFAHACILGAKLVGVTNSKKWYVNFGGINGEKAKQKLFDSSNYYERCRVLSKRRGEYHHSNLVDAKGLHAFANLLFENTLIHPDMAFYKYLTQTAFSNPSRIPEAVVHAAKLRHFKIMTENTLEVMKYTEKTKSLYESFCEHANKIRGDAKERIRELGRVEKSVIKEAKIRYARLHDDFRENARGALDSLTSMVKSYKQNYLFHNVKDAE